jgi:hypothetical protein
VENSSFDRPVLECRYDSCRLRLPPALCLNFPEILLPQYLAYGNTYIAFSIAGTEFNTSWYEAAHLTL